VIVPLSPLAVVPLSGSVSDNSNLSLVEGFCSCALLSIDAVECDMSNDRNEPLIAGREACSLDDAVFSRTPNCVGRVFMLLRGLRESLSLFVF